ncbi:MAG TPA: alanine--tRNA ligase, partial [Chloroflexota bacterium]|nr:alanine--tRNA ligase [Chloroflexota bacterium]
GIEPDKIWATTWAGEPDIPADEEAVALWQATGVPRERIRPMNRKPEGGRENFWGPTGDSGPCGPCSEINVDVLGACPLGLPDERCGPGGQWVTPEGVRYDHDCGRFVEIWNLVFNQYFQQRDKTLRPLPQTGIDTGSGFERVVAVVQGVPSAYESDLLLPIVREVERVLDAPYGEDPQLTRAIRVVVDHARAVTFMIADNVLPSNAERGYVARRLLRRAVRYGRMLGGEGPFMARVAQAVVDRFGGHYPHLEEKRAMIAQVVADEEARFSQTLAAGTELLNEELERLGREGQRVLSGETAFKLYGTFGFPVELTEEVAQGRGFALDRAGFDAALRADRERNREGRPAAEVDLGLPSVRGAFEGYEHLAVEGARLLYLRQDGEPVSTAAVGAGGAEGGSGDATTDGHEPGHEVWAVLDRTPFYGERGGQVGDSGWLDGPHGRMRVRDTKIVADVVVHLGAVVEGYLNEGDTVRAVVDEGRRQATMRHHTATHLLHAVLRAELGSHVHQTGSLVAPDQLRFDFSYGQALTPAQRQAIQTRVNEAIRRNLEVRTDVMPVDEAMRSGAVALFDEKYGETVRVLTIGDVSKELCGGTHVRRTGEIGSFLVAREYGIAAGMRRIEALAGTAAEAYVERQLEALDAIGRQLEVPRESAPERIGRLLTELAETRRRLEAAERRATQQGLDGVLGQAQEVAVDGTSVKVLAAELDAATAPTRERLREANDWLRDKLGGPSVLFLASTVSGNPQLLVTVSNDLTGRGLSAHKLIQTVNRVMGSRGGGRPDLAEGGGGDPARL